MKQIFQLIIFKEVSLTLVAAEESLIANIYIYIYITGPKLKFPTCSVFQNVIFPHISYT